MEQPKVSIIVPIYKVEKYLGKCLDSLLNQTLKEIEIICINDGSPDNSISILKDYQKKHGEELIKIIDKQNEGVWKARFDGICKASGEYIAFVDPDDYVALDYTEKLYNSAKKNNSDITVCGFCRMDVETNHIFSQEMKSKTENTIDLNKEPERILTINTALWNKLYRAETLKNVTNIKNPPKILEDMMFLLLVYLNVKTISFIPETLYYYMVRSDSAMSQIKENQIKQTENAMDEIKSIYEARNVDISRLEILDSMAFLHFGISLMLRVSDDKSNFKRILKENREYLNTKYPLWRKTKYLSMIYCLKHKGKNLKVAIMKKIYVLHLYGMFLSFYKFIQKKLKIDIKW